MNYYGNYGNYNYQPYQPFQRVEQTDDRIWVQGEGAAQAYLVAANGFVRLWDSQEPVFYEKRADATGKPYMEVYEYKPKRSESPKTSFFDKPQTVEGTNELKAEIDDLKARISALESKRRPKKEEVTDESIQ